MTASPDEVAGYEAALQHRWARGRRARNTHVPVLDGDSRDEGAPAGATPEFLAGWREGIDATAAW